MASQLFDHQRLSTVLREQSYKFLNRSKKLALLKKPVLGAAALAVVSFTVIFHGCAPSEREQKQIARRAVERTLKQADQSPEIQKLASAVRTRATLTQSVRAMAEDYESAEPAGGFFALSSGLGNAAAAYAFRDQENQFSKLKDLHFAKHQILRRRIAWSKMTATEQKYVTKQDPEFVRWLDDGELKKLFAEGKLRQ